VLIDRLTLDFRLGLSGRPFLSRIGVEVPELYGVEQTDEAGVSLGSGCGATGDERNGEEAERTTGRESGMVSGGRGPADLTGDGERTGNGTGGDVGGDGEFGGRSGVTDWGRGKVGLGLCLGVVVIVSKLGSLCLVELGIE